MTGRKLFARYKLYADLLSTIICKTSKKNLESSLHLLRGLQGITGAGARYCILKCLCKQLGDNVLIKENVYIYYPENISFGDNVSIHPMCYIDAEGSLEIGSNVSIAHSTTIVTSNHNYKDKKINIKYAPMELKKVKIGNNVWIGAGVRILAGSKIGNNVVIGAGAIVTKNIGNNCIAMGIPAKKVKEISEVER